ncbi:MAG: 4Fe-4S cluster-binding domain-containing protein [Pyrinomonadaceae bacterium]
MSNEITLILESDSGKLTTEVSGISNNVIADLKADLGTAQNINCAKPLERDIVKLPASNVSTFTDNQSIWLHRMYHNSVVDGPGRRSVIQVAGCSIRCPGCYVPETHIAQNGRLVTVSFIVEEVFRERFGQDGVTILGGEPFDQPGSVAEIVYKLNRLDLHITIYSGYTLETLIGRKDSNIDYILTHVDLLIDGPFMPLLAANAGEYRGSRNQRQFAQLTRII